MLVVEPFEEKHLADAAELFVSNYRLLRKRHALMPEKYEDRDVIIPFVRNLAGETQGVVALRGKVSQWHCLISSWLMRRIMDSSGVQLTSNPPILKVNISG